MSARTTLLSSQSRRRFFLWGKLDWLLKPARRLKKYGVRDLSSRVLKLETTMDSTAEGIQTLLKRGGDSLPRQPAARVKDPPVLQW